MNNEFYKPWMVNINKKLLLRWFKQNNGKAKQLTQIKYGITIVHTKYPYKKGEFIFSVKKDGKQCT